MDQLLVALDVDSGASAISLVKKLRGLVGGFKVGSRLFTIEGPDFVKKLVDSGNRVFLDLKFHDIPNTVKQAVEAATWTGAWMINVHISGGISMMQAAINASKAAAANSSYPKPLLIGVTMLTSIDAQTLKQIGIDRPLREHVVALAKLAKDTGLDGVVASPQETADIRQACGENFTIVTPGIRGFSAGENSHDQSRTMGPEQAIKAGADYIVVGRPIITASDPRVAAQTIVNELAKL